MRLFLSVLCCCVALQNFSQTPGYKWFDPVSATFPMLEGQAWRDGLASPYDRFPARAEETVPSTVWSLSRNSAGMYLQFKSNASDIRIRYTVRDTAHLSVFHMPATGVSGIDLYAVDHNGSWVWAPGRFSFGDTIEYSYSGLLVDSALKGQDAVFRVYLPNYNTVAWMQIGVQAGNSFTALQAGDAKPVIVYGTSIAQGGCATRPGMAWTAILQRKLGMPLINLGFSGNGRLDKSVVDLINEKDAALFVIDCMPNVTPPSGLKQDEVERRLIEAVTQLRSRHPHTPILLTEQASEHNLDVISGGNRTNFQIVNNTMRHAVKQLSASGISNLFTLNSDDIHLDGDATVDGVHPNDLGMMNYANAYNRVIRTILHMKQ